MNDSRTGQRRYGKIILKKVQMVLTKMNSYLNLPVYSLICM